MKSTLHPPAAGSLRIVLAVVCCLAGLSGWAQVVVSSEQPHHAQPTPPQENSVPLKNALRELESRHAISFNYNSSLVKGKFVALPTPGATDWEQSLQAMLRPLGLLCRKLDAQQYVIYDEQNKNLPRLLRKKISLSQEPVPANLANLRALGATRLLATSQNVPTGPVAGRVTTADGEGLPGVSVVIKNASVGTVTDASGQYSLTVPTDDATLVFSFIGYVSEEIAVRNQTEINVTMLEDIKALQEIVAVGYGEQEKKDVTGAVSSINATELRGLPQVGIDQMIQGRAAGVMVTNNSGQPGAGVSVRIRGITSLTGSNEPLYVIDGVPVGGDGVQTQAFNAFGGGGGQTSQSILSTVNPADIVTIDVLKDASATAIYGARGANGVVMITTRRGTARETRVTYDAYYGVQQVPRTLSMLDLPQYAGYITQLNRDNRLTAVEEFRDPSLLGKGTNWQREVFRQAPMMSHQLGFSGGGEKTQFYLSAGYMKQDGIVIGSSFDRYSVRLNLDHQLKSWFKIGNSLTVSRSNQRVTLTDSDDGVVSAALLQAPNIPVRNPDGSWGGFVASPTGVAGGFPINPVAHALLKDVRLTQNRILGNFYADITLLKHFTFRTEFGGDVNFTENTAFNPTYAWGSNVNTVNTLIAGAGQSYYWILKNFLTYNRTFGTNHRLTAVAGHEAQQSTWAGISGTAVDLPSNSVLALGLGDPKLAATGQYKGAFSIESYFARVFYSFADRYSLTLTGRADASSRFGPANKWGFFPSVAAAWTVSNEAFMRDVSALSSLKLRVGYGVVGNQNIPNYAYGAALANVPTPRGTAFYPGNLANPLVKWESATQANLGLDVGLLQGKISVALDVYDKISRDFLFQSPMPTFTGAGANYDQIKAPYVNLGQMQNRGLDLTVTSHNVNKGKFSWNTTLIFSHYRNRLLNIDGQTPFILQQVQWFNDVTISQVGQPVGQFYGWQTAGLIQSPDQLTSLPLPTNAKIGSPTQPNAGVYLGDVVFRNNDTTSLAGKQVIDGRDRAIIGSPHPNFTFGLTNSFTFAGFDLSVFLQGAQGSKIFNFTRRSTEGMNNLGFNQATAVLGRWTSDNPGNGLPRAMLGDPNSNNRVSDRFVEDGSYLRIQNVTLGYALTPKLLRRLHLTRLRVYASAQNLKTFSRYSGFDPELGSFNQNAMLMNIDNGHYPVPRTYTFGLNIEL